MKLDRRASDEVAVAPIRVELDRPEIGDVHTLVGYGNALGASCDSGYGTKRKGDLALSAGKVAGVSSVAVNAGNAAYDATFFAADWIANRACSFFGAVRRLHRLGIVRRRGHERPGVVDPHHRPVTGPSMPFRAGDRGITAAWCVIPACRNARSAP